jgi:uncharacterized coiled-coil protein SlyX
MAALEQRVSYLEGQVNEQSQALAAFRDALGRFEQRVDARFNAVDARFNAFEQRVDARFNGLENKMSTQFLWIIGVQVTVLVAVLAAMLSRS